MSIKLYNKEIGNIKIYLKEKKKEPEEKALWISKSLAS